MNSTAQETTTKLIYLMDPQCGWCFGNGNSMTELVNELPALTSIDVIPGGMWIGSNAPVGGQAFAGFIQQHSPRMEQITGRDLGDGFHQLTLKEDYTFDSEEASQAIVAVRHLFPEQALSFAKLVQDAQFIEGKRFDDVATYTGILTQLKLDTKAFENYWQSEANKADTQNAFHYASQLANGFPTLIIEVDGKMSVLANGAFDAKEVKARIDKLTKK